MRVDGALTARVMLGDRTLLSTGESRAFADRLLGELERLPGVQHAAFASSLPPATSIVQMAIRVVEGGRDEMQMMALVAATPSWSEAVGVRLVDGRFLRTTDGAGEQPVVVVSRSTARHLFRDRRAVGLSLPYAIPGTGGVVPPSSAWSRTSAMPGWSRRFRERSTYPGTPFRLGWSDSSSGRAAILAALRHRLPRWLGASTRPGQSKTSGP